ncbi:MAG: NUMOD4 motif-containing HNH endonuclease [Bacteroidales bacterium]|nr:NUMOD4 motif-containing HNH endonuclease [Bacteroidales bacterium]
MIFNNEKIYSEMWKPIDIEGMALNEKYQVSNYGRIKSFKVDKENGIIINGSNLKGYKILNIKLDGNKRTTKYVHKLVAECFIPKDNDQQQYVIHLDFDKTNNHCENLKWVTRETMFAHQKINPNYKRGAINYSKLTETDVIRLKKKLARGKNKLYKLAKEFGITHTQLNRIRKGENWGHVKID